MVRRSVEEQFLEAIQRLEAGRPERAPDNRLSDHNLVVESGSSRASFYRCARAVETWQAVKEASVLAALDRMEALAAQGQSQRDQAELLAWARIEPAALRRMPATVMDRWDRITQPQVRSRELSKDEIIANLVAKLYATTLAVRKRDAIIAEQAAQIAQLGGNITPLRPKGSN